MQYRLRRNLDRRAQLHAPGSLEVPRPAWPKAPVGGGLTTYPKRGVLRGMTGQNSLWQQDHQSSDQVDTKLSQENAT